MTTKPEATVAQYRPALCLSDAMPGPGSNVALIHMGREYGRGAVAACGAMVWCFGSAFNPEYRVCPRCIEAAGYDPRPMAQRGLGL